MLRRLFFMHYSFGSKHGSKKFYVATAAGRMSEESDNLSFKLNLKCHWQVPPPPPTRPPCPVAACHFKALQKNERWQLKYLVVQAVMSFGRAHPTAHAGWHPSRSQKSPASQCQCQCQAQWEEEV